MGRDNGSGAGKPVSWTLPSSASDTSDKACSCEPEFPCHMTGAVPASPMPATSVIEHKHVHRPAMHKALAAVPDRTSSLLWPHTLLGLNTGTSERNLVLN